ARCRNPAAESHLPGRHPRWRDDHRKAVEPRHAQRAIDGQQGAAALVRDEQSARVRVGRCNSHAVVSWQTDRRRTGRFSEIPRVSSPAQQGDPMMKRTLFLVLLAAATLRAQAPFDRLLHADREPQNWLTYSGGLAGQRYTALNQITPNNVKRLEQQWIFQARSLEKFEATPLVVDGILYTVQAPNDIVALDAVTGRTFWVYSYRPSL